MQLLDGRGSQQRRIAVERKITIIGIGDDGFEWLTRQALEFIASAGTLFGPASLLNKVPAGNFDKVVLSADLEVAVRAFASAPRGPLVMLASGDPLFYGVARYLCDRLGKDRFEVLPHVSSMQLAFARVKESWDEAYLTNLASQGLPQVIGRIRGAEKVGLFTTPECPPNRVAQALLDQEVDYFTAYVRESRLARRAGYPRDIG